MQSDIDKRTGRPYGDHETPLQAITYSVEVLKVERDTFLKSWMEGDLDEWPEFYEWLAKQPVEAALSTDAEPVGYTDQSELTNDQGHGIFAHASSDRKWLGDNPIALYSEPVKTAPAVAVKAIEAVWKYSLVIESSVRRGDGPDQYAGVTEALRLVKEARSALSAQVQDVAGWWLAPDDATEEMIAAALKVDWSNENEAAAAHNIWHAMRSASPAPKHGEEG